MPTLTRSRRELRAQVDLVLCALGNDAGEVARRLEAAAVRGRPRDPRGCAVAVYLSSVVAADPQVRAVLVTTKRVVVKPASWWQPPIAVPLSRALRAFLTDFDRDVYPALVRPKPGAARRMALPEQQASP
jgi:hypothetical protein